MLVKVTEVEHYTERLFRFRTERPATFRFSAGEFTMVGIENVEDLLKKENNSRKECIALPINAILDTPKIK